MTVPLAEALQQVELEPGRTYRCQVKGNWIELRVLASLPDLMPAPLAESDIMFDPWVELPDPPPAGRIRVTRSEPVLPDIPNILSDDEVP